MARTTLLALLVALGVHFAIKAYQYSRASKLGSVITWFEEEPGYGRRSMPMNMAYVTYSYEGNVYEVPIRDAWLFEHAEPGTVVPLLIDPTRPDRAVADGFFTFWLRVQVLMFMVLGAFILFAVLGFFELKKGEDGGLY